MADWGTTLSGSPPRRFSTSSTASTLLWKSQYSEPHGNIWNSCSSLQPSATIWGTQIKSPSQSSVPQITQPVSLLQSTLASPSTISNSKFGPVPGQQYRQRRMSSIPSLSGSVSSISSSSLWFEDPYLVSPPPSPETTAEVDNTNPPAASLSPARSPKSASLSPMVPQEEFAISATSGPLYFVQFKGKRVDVFTAPGTAVYKFGEAVMVDADRGRDLGTVVAVNVTRHDAAALKQRQSQDRQTALHTSGCTNNNNSNAIHSSSNTTLNNEGSSSSSASSGPTIYSPKQILGPASVSEISDMNAKINDESAAVALCNKKASERHLDIKIVDAEYQWDRRKLTFFYTAESRVDFRDLVRELFRVYKTRIWMCATTSQF